VPAEPLWLHPKAIEEARAAREWYLVRSPAAGEAFMAEFPFFVVFRETDARIEIVAVAHARRRPGYWLGR
jgi:hypothetical protein